MKSGPKRKTTRDLPAGWRGTMLSLARQGQSEQIIREQLRLSISLWYGLLRRDPKLRDAVKASREVRLSRRLGVAV